MLCFKRLYYLNGWALDGLRAPPLPRLMLKGRSVPSSAERTTRSDLERSFPGCDPNGGFTIRAILAPEVDPAELSLQLGETEITNPGALTVMADAEGLNELNRVFFAHARQGRVLEIGSRARSQLVRRELFGQADYCGLDVMPGENVDVVGDAHELTSSFPAQSFDSVYSVSVFEHLIWPWKAVLEINAVLRTGGLVFTQSHQAWPKHDEPWDFYRFSSSGWRGLFNATTGFEVVKTEDALPGVVLSAAYAGDPAHRFENGSASLVSACLARKVGEPRVRWDAAPDYAGLGDYPA